jgi:hypothetical protein
LGKFLLTRARSWAVADKLAIENHTEALMMNFHDAPTLRDILRKTYEIGGQQGHAQALLAHVLEAKMDFAQDQAKLYASTVLSRNADTSPDSMIVNADKLIGTWVRSTESGISGGCLKTMRETWEFEWDLEFEHKTKTDESYGDPFGEGFSRPTSCSERGQWAPSDSEASKEVYVVVIANGVARRLQLIWPDDSEKPGKFSMGGTEYFRKY